MVESIVAGIAGAVSGVATAAAGVMIVAIAAVSILFYTQTISIDDVKELYKLFKGDRWGR